MAAIPTALTTSIETFAGFLTSNKRVDVVKILDQATLQQVFQEARPLEAYIREASKGLKYPIETGATLTDSVIVEPTEISITMFIPSSSYATVYPLIRTARLNGTFFSVQTRTGTYNNMYIQDMPHKEDSQMMDAITMQIRFVEALQVGASQNGSTQVLNNFSPANPSDALAVSQGLLSGIAVPTTILSAFHAASVLGL